VQSFRTISSSIDRGDIGSDESEYGADDVSQLCRHSNVSGEESSKRSDKFIRALDYSCPEKFLSGYWD
jgi:hypothetical protein